jgi:hydroxymethylglutaryl-CoA reductase
MTHVQYTTVLYVIAVKKQESLRIRITCEIKNPHTRSLGQGALQGTSDRLIQLMGQRGHGDLRTALVRGPRIENVMGTLALPEGIIKGNQEGLIVTTICDMTTPLRG